jgi:hypothetical protein
MAQPAKAAFDKQIAVLPITSILPLDTISLPTPCLALNH